MYNGKERILKAFAREKSDRLPVFDVVNKPDMYENLLGQSNFNSGGRLCVQLAKKLNDITEANWEMIPLHIEFEGAKVICAE